MSIKIITPSHIRQGNGGQADLQQQYHYHKGSGNTLFE
ncbi:hypothetical protein J2X05_004024 [Cellvibrio fibrivorans]|uniref:Uncharacterized protein n=1 Tax=Cellvibrio fibrivorans TaxID=126350 RepID=A0ABU1V3F0_9GAMM|nr:hypothetical protein [Cellvibrio fibrivorans]